MHKRECFTREYGVVLPCHCYYCTEWVLSLVCRSCNSVNTHIGSYTTHLLWRKKALPLWHRVNGPLWKGGGRESKNLGCLFASQSQFVLFLIFVDFLTDNLYIYHSSHIDVKISDIETTLEKK